MNQPHDARHSLRVPDYSSFLQQDRSWAAPDTPTTRKLDCAAAFPPVESEFARLSWRSSGLEKLDKDALLILSQPLFAWSGIRSPRSLVR